MRMNKYGPTKENLLLALPHVLRQDPNMLALADSIATVLSAQWDEIDLLRIYQRIDELDEELLDILAYDFKVDWWDPNYSLDVKRQVLKDNWRVHRMLGTRAALELALSAIYPGARAEEWFEYGGTPYCFRLYIDASDADIGDAKHRRVLDKVNYWKNLRSHLEGIEYHKTIPTGNLYAGVGVVARRHISILNARQQASELAGTQYAAVGLQAMPYRTILNGGGGIYLEQPPIGGGYRQPFAGLGPAIRRTDKDRPFPLLQTAVHPGNQDSEIQITLVHGLLQVKDL